MVTSIRNSLNVGKLPTKKGKLVIDRQNNGVGTEAQFEIRKPSDG